MSDKLSGEPQDWTETNILPFSPAQPEDLLIGVVDRLVHETLSEHIESWHYFWEDKPIYMRHLRLRVLWRLGQGGEGRAALTAYLDEAEAAEGLWRWYPGNNGIPGEEYQGEAAGYDGPEMWQVTYRDWQAGSDLALALLKLDAEGRLAEGREFHLQRRVHLHSNRVGLNYFDEGKLYLHLTIGYLAEAGLATTPDGANILQILRQINDAIRQA